jgi:hypothetical protein
MEMTLDAKALIAWAFRNDPIETCTLLRHAPFAVGIRRSPTSLTKR